MRPPAGLGGSSLARQHERSAAASTEERKAAFFLGGHTWNPINQQPEVYLRHARNHEHYVDERGRATRQWMQPRRRLDLDGDGTCDLLDSAPVHEALRCPATAGKDSARGRTRQVRQLCQASAPRDYGLYSARCTSAAPATARRAESPQAATPRNHVDRASWTQRRGEARVERLAPPVHEVYRRAEQLQAESHFDVSHPNFAMAMQSAREVRAPALVDPEGFVSTRRSMFGEDRPPRAQGFLHSTTRVDTINTREVSMDVTTEKDKLKRGDPFHTRPVQQTGSSSIKYGILTNEMKPFWY